jgi:hypothetical protein
MQQYGTGYVPDRGWSVGSLNFAGGRHVLENDRPTSLRFGFTSAVPILSSYSLQPFAVVNDQATTESCVGWALKNSIDIHARAMGFQVTMDPESADEGTSPPSTIASPAAGPNLGPLDPRSAMAIWSYAQIMQRVQDGDTALTEPIQNVGVQPVLAAQGMMKRGVPSDKQWPFDSSKVGQEPTLVEQADASAFRVAGYHRVLSAGPQRLADIRLAIQNNCPVFVGVQIDKAFMNYSSGILRATTDATTIVGGHGTCLIGFDSDGSFLGLNQWTTGWGLGGFYRAASDWVLSPFMGDIIVVTGELVPQGDVEPLPGDDQ